MTNAIHQHDGLSDRDDDATISSCDLELLEQAAARFESSVSSFGCDENDYVAGSSFSSFSHSHDTTTCRTEHGDESSSFGPTPSLGDKFSAARFPPRGACNVVEEAPNLDTAPTRVIRMSESSGDCPAFTFDRMDVLKTVEDAISVLSPVQRVERRFVGDVTRSVRKKGGDAPLHIPSRKLTSNDSTNSAGSIESLDPDGRPAMQKHEEPRGLPRRASSSVALPNVRRLRENREKEFTPPSRSRNFSDSFAAPKRTALLRTMSSRDGGLLSGLWSEHQQQAHLQHQRRRGSKLAGLSRSDHGNVLRARQRRRSSSTTDSSISCDSEDSSITLRVGDSGDQKVLLANQELSTSVHLTRKRPPMRTPTAS